MEVFVYSVMVLFILGTFPAAFLQDPAQDNSQE